MKRTILLVLLAACQVKENLHGTPPSTSAGGGSSGDSAGSAGGGAVVDTTPGDSPLMRAQCAFVGSTYRCSCAENRVVIGQDCVLPANRGNAGACVLPEGTSPCALTLHDSTCVSASDNVFTCACNDGYRLNGTSCELIPPCDAACDVNATCTGLLATSQCVCNARFIGDGKTCTALPAGACEGTCVEHSVCSGGPFPKCICAAGYALDPVAGCLAIPCGQACDPNATCETASNACVCNAGYAGNGSVCTSTATCGICGAGASCHGLTCECDEGYVGDGITCTAAPCDCGDNAVCDTSSGPRICSCAEGYFGDGYTCQAWDQPQHHLGVSDFYSNENCVLDAQGLLRCWGDGEAVSVIEGHKNQFAGVNLPLLESRSGLETTMYFLGSISSYALTPNVVAIAPIWEDYAALAIRLLPSGAHSLWVVGETSAAKILDSGAWLTVAGGGAGNCAIKDNHSLWCGLHLTRFGVLAQIGQAKDWSRIAVGQKHFCGIREASAERTLWCWGDNSEAQLGTGTRGGASSAPVQVSTFTDWQDVTMSADDVSSCALRGGAVYCWGRDDAGALGQGPLVDRYVTAPAPVVAPNTFVEVAHTQSHTCAREVDDSVRCFGARTANGIGDGSTVAAAALPVRVGTDTWRSVALVDEHTDAIKSDGTLWTFGDQRGNANSWIGVDLDPDWTSTPTPLLAGNAWLDLGQSGAQSLNACARQSDHSLWCLGANREGQVDPSAGTSFILAPHQVSVEAWSQVSEGAEAICGLQAGHAFCWGKNPIFGGVDETTPTEVPGAFSDWVALSVGASHACGIRDDGAGHRHLLCWGANDFGELGNGGTAASLTPVDVGFTDWSSVAAGSAFGDPTTEESTCGSRSDGAGHHTLWCWGQDAGGAVLSRHVSPTQVGTFTDWATTSDASDYRYGIRDDGAGARTLWRMSRDPRDPQYGVAVQFGGDSDWASISAANANHACGLKTDGALFCWGKRINGATGDGSASAFTPVLVQ